MTTAWRSTTWLLLGASLILALSLGTRHGFGLFLPPMGVGLLMALRFANLSVGQHWRAYLPYVLALMVGLLLIILFPQISLFLPRSAGLIK